MWVMVVGGASKQAVSSGEPNRRRFVRQEHREFVPALLLDNPHFEAPNLFHAYLTLPMFYRA